MIYVFGSNLAGRHGKGTALHAVSYYGAIYGVGEGIQGRAYGIPTKDVLLKTRPLKDIEASVNKFLAFAAYVNLHSEDKFYVTPVGCGLAGYTPEDIAPMFSQRSDNVILNVEFADVLRNR